MKVGLATFAGLSIAASGSTSSAAPLVIRTAVSPSNPLIGTWQRTNSCQALVRALTLAGLKSQIHDTLVGAGYFQSASQISLTNPCKSAQNLKHSHFFTAAGDFGSYDQSGNQVDNGNYAIVAPDTLAFPSHTRDFGYKITVHYMIKHGALRFSVVIPHPCTGKCPGATAWALSAFYPGPPFTRSK